MSIRDRAKTLIAKATTPPPDGRKEDRLLIPKTRMRLVEFLSSPDMMPIFEIAQDYSKKVDIEVGFLFDPIPNQPSFSPAHQASNKPGSQYYSAKVIIPQLGSVFVIPLSSKDNKFVVCIKPARSLKSDISLGSATFKALGNVFIYEPYTELSDTLLAWSSLYEALSFIRQNHSR